MQSEAECAYQCLTSCGINEVCDYYKYEAQLCTLGNLDFQLGPAVFEVDTDCLPLTKIMYNKNKVTDIKTKLAGADRGSCNGAAADIELVSGASVEVEPTATDGNCIFYVYNNNGGTVRLTLTETVCIPNCYLPSNTNISFLFLGLFWNFEFGQSSNDNLCWRRQRQRSENL